MSDVREFLIEKNPGEELLFVEDLDEAILGTAMVKFNTVVVYGTWKSIQAINKKNKDWSLSDSIEWFYGNVEGVGVGEKTPIFVDELDENHSFTIWEGENGQFNKA